jgi:hypothetical protein
MSAKLPPGTLDKLWNDPANWRARYIYSCKADPRFVVPKRNRWAGWTINFAHPGAWIYLIAGISIAVAMGGAASQTHRPLIVIGTVFVIVIATSALGRWQSSPSRFEDHE